MGYCYITGKRIKPKRWKFLECDGRSWRCAQDNKLMPGKSSKECVEWCISYKQAVRAIEDWIKLHPEEKEIRNGESNET